MGAVALHTTSVSGGVFLNLEKNGAPGIAGAATATFRQGSTGYTNSGRLRDTDARGVPSGSPHDRVISANGQSTR